VVAAGANDTSAVVRKIDLTQSAQLPASSGCRKPRFFRLLTAGLPFPHVSAMVGTSQRFEERRRDQMTKSEPWVSLEEISQHLGVSQDTVHRWIRNRKMPAHQIGRLWKFKVSEVDEWVRQGKTAEDASKK
jgi:excisionase family DNA binding protein